jgi:hypothetical protein
MTVADVTLRPIVQNPLPASFRPTPVFKPNIDTPPNSDAPLLGLILYSRYIEIDFILNFGGSSVPEYTIP